MAAEKLILLQREIYENLYKWYLDTYREQIRDMYDGHYHAERQATRYAINNTKQVWKEQYEHKQ